MGPLLKQMNHLFENVGCFAHSLLVLHFMSGCEYLFSVFVHTMSTLEGSKCVVICFWQILLNGGSQCKARFEPLWKFWVGVLSSKWSPELAISAVFPTPSQPSIYASLLPFGLDGGVLWEGINFLWECGRALRVWDFWHGSDVHHFLCCVPQPGGLSHQHGLVSTWSAPFSVLFPAF